MAAPVTTKPDASVADRLNAVKARLGDPKDARRLYALRIVSSKERPAPFEAATVAGHCFAEKTYRRVEDSRGRDEVSVREDRLGTFESLTDAEVEKIRTKMKDYIVRWMNRENLIAQVIDATILNSDGTPKVVLDPSTDEMLEPYLSIESVPG